MGAAKAVTGTEYHSNMVFDRNGVERRANARLVLSRRRSVIIKDEERLVLCSDSLICLVKHSLWGIFLYQKLVDTVKLGTQHCNIQYM